MVGYIDVPIIVDNVEEVEEEYFNVNLALWEADNNDNNTLAKLGCVVCSYFEHRNVDRGQ